MPKFLFLTILYILNNSFIQAQSPEQIQQWVAQNDWTKVLKAAKKRDIAGYLFNTSDQTIPLLHHAVQQGQETVALAVLKKASKKNAVLFGPALAILLSVERSHPMDSLAEALIRRGAKPASGRNLLRYAIRQQSPSLAQAQIERWGLPTADSSELYPPLHYALLHDQKTIFQALLRAGADVNTRNSTGITPFMLALQLEQYDVVEELLELGASLQCSNERGEPPIILAARRQRHTLVDRLLAAGADSSRARSAFGHSVRQLLYQTHPYVSAKFLVISQIPPFFELGSQCPEAQRGSPEAKKCSDNALLQFISKTLRYPAAAREAGLEGSIYISFIVNSEGYVRNIEVLKGKTGLLADEAIAVIRQMNEFGKCWLPGMQDGEVAAVKLILPLKFKLSE